MAPLATTIPSGWAELIIGKASRDRQFLDGGVFALQPFSAGIEARRVIVAAVAVHGEQPTGEPQNGLLWLQKFRTGVDSGEEQIKFEVAVESEM